MLNQSSALHFHPSSATHYYPTTQRQECLQSWRAASIYGKWYASKWRTLWEQLVWDAAKKKRLGKAGPESWLQNQHSVMKKIPGLF